MPTRSYLGDNGLLVPRLSGIPRRALDNLHVFSRHQVRLPRRRFLLRYHLRPQLCGCHDFGLACGQLRNKKFHGESDYLLTAVYCYQLQ